MYGITISIILAFCLASSVYAEAPGSSSSSTLNVPEFNDNPATVEDIQKKADGLLNQVVDGVKSSNRQAVTSAFDDGITYYLAEKDSILSNIPTLLNTVGRKARDVAASASWPEWNSVVSTFFSWASSSDKGGAVMEVTPIVLATGAAAGFSAPAPAQPTAWAGTQWENSAKEAASSGPGDSTHTAFNENAKAPEDSTGSASAATATAVDKPAGGFLIDGLDDGTSKISGAKLVSAKATPSTLDSNFFNGADLADLQVAKCFRMPGRKPVGCRPGAANLCYNSNGVSLPCP